MRPCEKQPLLSPQTGLEMSRLSIKTLQCLLPQTGLEIALRCPFKISCGVGLMYVKKCDWLGSHVARDSTHIPSISRYESQAINA